MATPSGLWVRLSARFPESKKIKPLTDAAFRAYVEMLCWCKDQDTDGLIEADMIPTFGKPAKVINELKRRELLDDAGDGDLAIHDYDEWQELSTASTTRRKSHSVRGSKGAHDRWHTGRGVIVDDCPFCVRPAS